MGLTSEAQKYEVFAWPDRKRRGGKCEQRFVDYLQKTYGFDVVIASAATPHPRVPVLGPQSEP